MSLAKDAARGTFTWDGATEETGDVGWDAAWDITSDSAWHAAREAASNAAKVADWGDSCDVVTATAWNASSDAVKVVSTVNVFAAFDHPALTKFIEIMIPMLDAFEAGLFVYWVTPHEVVCVLLPALRMVNGNLHRVDGPAVVWPSGEAYYFWHGVQVSAWIIEEPHRITVDAIRDEVNQEIRRCMTEIYGLSRYLRDASAQLLHQDEHSKLWEAQVGDET